MPGCTTASTRPSPAGAVAFAKAACVLLAGQGVLRADDGAQPGQQRGGIGLGGGSHGGCPVVLQSKSKIYYIYIMPKKVVFIPFDL